MTDDLTHPLRHQMQQVGISSFAQLSRLAGVSQSQVRSLRCGQAAQMRLETLLKLAETLQISLAELLSTFARIELTSGTCSLTQEYDRLQSQLEQARSSSFQDFQHLSLEVLEPWMLQWPTFARAAEQNPELPAVRGLPLVKPVEKLLQNWGVEALASVGDIVPYNPQEHQLIEGSVHPGELVRVRYTGYRQGDRLLHRAKVSPIDKSP
jgi:transcriptional regulator with XRE-family HTH domain